jgi:hypothetical protein
MAARSAFQRSRVEKYVIFPVIMTVVVVASAIFGYLWTTVLGSVLRTIFQRK